MFEPHLKIPESQSDVTFPQTVVCPERHCEAEIIVACWPYSEEGWSGWRVVQCSLLPRGMVGCAMDCLSQAKLRFD